MDILDDVSAEGVRTRRFDLAREGSIIPGLLWTPAHATGGRPLVGIGHGASGHKAESYVSTMGRHLAQAGLAAVAIDGPVHGDRRADGGSDPYLSFLEFSAAWANDPTVTDATVADWQHCFDALQQLDDVGPGPLGYWGVSMGTILGLPLVAAEPRISVAVLGLFGSVGPTADRICSDAAKVSCPIRFLAQLDDELFAFDHVLDLFRLLGTEEKSLHLNPGRHSAVPSAEFFDSGNFLVAHLLGTTTAAGA